MDSNEKPFENDDLDWLTPTLCLDEDILHQSTTDRLFSRNTVVYVIRVVAGPLVLSNSSCSLKTTVYVGILSMACAGVRLTRSLSDARIGSTGNPGATAMYNQIYRAIYLVRMAKSQKYGIGILVTRNSKIGLLDNPIMG